VWDGAAWACHSYADLAVRVERAASGLRDDGLLRGDIVAIAESNCVDFLVAFFGVLVGGGTPVPLGPHRGLRAAYEDRFAGVLRAASPKFVIAPCRESRDFVDAGREAGYAGKITRLDDRECDGTSRSPTADIALLQFTSGSSGAIRGIPLTWENLESNLASIQRWLGIGAGDGVASWLPLQHDMGLVGLFLTPICVQIPLWYMRPGQFLLEPQRWLECLGREGATISAAPTFGYSYVARRVGREQLEGLDLASWRCAIVGSERILPDALTQFEQRVKDHGFSSSAFRPAYGLAEATLAVTGHPLGSVPRAVQIGWERADIGTKVDVRQTRLISDPPRQGWSGYLVSCGRALAGLDVTVVDSTGRQVAEQTLGEVAVQGPSVAAGYHRSGAAGATRFDSGCVLTGDTGFLLDGELFVIGRLGDSVKVRGGRLYSETLEAELSAALGIPAHRCLVAPYHDEDGDGIAVLFERPPSGCLDTVLPMLRAQVGNALEIELYAAPAHTILRTTSGKPRRREMLKLIRSSALPLEVLYPAKPKPSRP
jgi:acyl-CoA synthetase (AMP-forming)/AMP-acid ligase II